MEEPEVVEVDLDVVDAWDNLAAVAGGVGRVLLDLVEATDALDEGGRLGARVGPRPGRVCYEPLRQD